MPCGRDAALEGALAQALSFARSGQAVIVDVAIDYSRKTYFTKGVVKTNFWRMPWPERLRLLGRAAYRHLQRLD